MRGQEEQNVKKRTDIVGKEEKTEKLKVRRKNRHSTKSGPAI